MPRPRSPRTFRGTLDGRVFVDVAAEGRLAAFHVELAPRSGFDWWQDPADARDLAHSILGWTIGLRAAGQFAAAFRDEVIAKLSPTGFELTEREVVSWLQSR
ncbi:MAG: DUF6166 domain-containing protein [Solirubrobacterales bacterium]